MPADRSFGGNRTQRIKTDNKIDLRPDISFPCAINTYDAMLADVWFYYVDADNKFVKTKDLAVGQRVKLVWTLDGSDIALKDDVPVKFSDRSLYSARCKGITGEPADTANLERAVGTKCEIDVETKQIEPADKAAYWWSTVKEARSRERRKATPPTARAAAPAASVSSPAPAPERAPEPARSGPTDPAIVLDRLLDAVPLRVSAQIRALAKWAQLDDAQLALKIAFFSGGEPLAINDVPKLNDKIRAERAA